MKQKNKKLKIEFKDNFYIIKWILLISAFLIIGGTFLFTMIFLFALLFLGKAPFEPIWIVALLPMMAALAIPLSLIIYRQVRKNISVLVVSMNKVAGGDLDTYIPTAEAKDFAKVYENFNKMVTEIQSIESLRTTMFDNLSHELKTPIASINGFSKLLIEKELPDEKQNKYLQIIASESERLEALVKNVLLLGKLDSIEIVANKEEYNLSEQLRDCVISLENDWTAKNINMSVELDDCIYKGEPQLVKSLWLNLISNAIKFTPENGTVNISLENSSKYITVSVSDTGIGISENDQKHIFEKHYQTDKQALGSGQGLGLAIVRRIIKLCGGSVAVKSSLGYGSTFTVTLPK